MFGRLWGYASRCTGMTSIVGMVVFICTAMLQLLGFNRAALRVFVKEWGSNMDGDVLGNVCDIVVVLLRERINDLGAEIAQERGVVSGLGVTNKWMK